MKAEELSVEIRDTMVAEEMICGFEGPNELSGRSSEAPRLVLKLARQHRAVKMYFSSSSRK